VTGKLPEDKEAMLAVLDRYLPCPMRRGKAYNGVGGSVYFSPLSFETRRLLCYQILIIADNIELTRGFVMPSSYAIGTHFERFVRKQIESGRYNNASEVVRDALRLMEEREELREAQLLNLRAQLQGGIHSGPGIPADEVLERLETKYKNLSTSS